MHTRTHTHTHTHTWRVIFPVLLYIAVNLCPAITLILLGPVIEGGTVSGEWNNIMSMIQCLVWRV